MDESSRDPAGNGPLSGSGLAVALGLLDQAAEALGALQPGELADGTLSELLVELDARQNVIDAARVRLVGVWDGRGVFAHDGARTAASWLASHTELSRPAAASQVKLARALRSMPATDAACAAGVLGQAKARLLAEAAGDVPEVFARDEEVLVAEAQGLTVAELARALSFWRALADPDGNADRADREHAARALHLSRSFQGCWLLNGKLTGEGGEVLDNEVDRLAREIYRAEKAAADATGGIVASTPAQRRADALVQLAMRSIAAGDTGNAINVPAITALIDIGKLADPDTQPGEIVGAHHLIHWINHGPTDLENLTLLCSFHHHKVHEGGFGLKRLPNGDLECTRPNGLTLTVPKGRAPDPGWPTAA